MINTRSSGLVNNASDYKFHILGCGAIGSSAAIQLARMGARNFVLYDMDKVELENIGVSQYTTKDIGKPKVIALRDILIDINPNCNISSSNKKFNMLYPGGKYVCILGFDNMDARMDVVKHCTNDLPKSERPDYIIDGRMGAEHYQQYIFHGQKPGLIQKYTKDWYSDKEGSIEPCNMKATSYCSSMSGSFIANTVRKLITNQPYNRKFSFNFPTMLLQKSVESS